MDVMWGNEKRKNLERVVDRHSDTPVPSRSQLERVGGKGSAKSSLWRWPLETGIQKKNRFSNIVRVWHGIARTIRRLTIIPIVEHCNDESENWKFMANDEYLKSILRFRYRMIVIRGKSSRSRHWRDTETTWEQEKAGTYRGKIIHTHYSPKKAWRWRPLQ